MRQIKTYFKGAPFYNAFIGTWPTERRASRTSLPLASSLRLRQEKRKMRTSKSSKSEILDNVPALCGVEKGIPTRYRGGIYETICVYARTYFHGRLNGLECVWPN